MKSKNTVVLSFAIIALLGGGCKEVLGIEDANLACPLNLPECKACETVADCDDSPMDCHAWKCAESMCTPINADPGTECSSGVCNDEPVAKCVACVHDEDCPDGGLCSQSNQCVAK